MWERIRSAIMAALGLAGLVAVAAILLDSSGIYIPTEDADPAAALRDRVTALRHRAALAREGRLVLLLDPADSTLTLYHGGAELEAWRVYDVEAGARRFAFTPPARDWHTRLWQHPRLVPPVERERRLIVSDSVVPPDPSGAVDWIPPTPEEAVPTPTRFVVHYTGGLGLEVVAEGADSLTSPTLVARTAAGLRHLHPRNLDRYRIRVRMPASEAGALYRSFPEDAALVVLPDAVRP